jgi:cysteine desulfuration protein SufE
VTHACSLVAQGLVAQFDALPDWESRYRRVIELGQKLEPLEASFKATDRFLIQGCVSKAWLVPSRRGSAVFFAADSEAAIVKGILALVVQVYSGASPAEILSFEPSFLERIGLTEHLSMNRRNGLSQVLKQIKLYATVFKAQDQLAPEGTP